MNIALQETTNSYAAFLAGPISGTQTAVIETVAGQTSDLKAGQMLYKKSNGKYGATAATETAIAIAATGGEIAVNNCNGTQTEFLFDLVNLPVPGSLTVVTTADGSATPVKTVTDGGNGAGESADGSLSVDYNTGRVRVVWAAAPTATHDIKVAYSHRGQGAGVPLWVLMENVPYAGAQGLATVDVRVSVLTGGRVRKNGLIGYSAGYKSALREAGIEVQDS